MSNAPEDIAIQSHWLTQGLVRMLRRGKPYDDLSHILSNKKDGQNVLFYRFFVCQMLKKYDAL